ncbi:hypothetical protein HELRODRAFT_75598, partial [Helobdella robusta]|uniref:Grh/CP2 DB domain-containing protein n=1 Tax=Helobdella robusta TaxID=6412 RepID=T1G271_HELRO
FQIVLMTRTSSLTKFDQETLTYLNQGQCYELKLKCLKGAENAKLLKSIIKIAFHERRLQYSEQDELNKWKAARPGERIIDVDIPMSSEIKQLKIDPEHVNSIEIGWDPNQPTDISIKIHCISTEFTANKHGGEKGVPLRIQVDTYLDDGKPQSPTTTTNNNNNNNNNNDNNNNDNNNINNYGQLVNSSSCQIKVFKPKGADRKHKRDNDKLAKMAVTQKEHLRPSCDYTILTEVS